MKAKTLPFLVAFLVISLLLGCNSDDAYSGSNSASLAPGPPVGEKTQFFPAGSTVNDIKVSGTGVRWYNLSPSAATVLEQESFNPNYNNPFFERTLLAPDTFLQNKKTYYATQTVNKRESLQYLKVAIELSEVSN
jgi:hypothetical protein